jgi:hopanoid biosynthesis associated protein HpnK
MRRLIVNADDFGFTRGVNAGIVRAFREGVLTSTTLMANGDAFDHAVDLARATPGLAVGIHLVAVGGRPVAPAREIPSLADRDGRFPTGLGAFLARLARGAVRTEDVEREFRAQVARVVAAGLTPSHLDTHKHTHAHPPVMEALGRVAREFGIRSVRNPFERIRARPPAGSVARRQRATYLRQWAISAAVRLRAGRFRRLAADNDLRTPDHFCGAALTGLLDGDALCGVIRSLAEGTTELMCHPGLCDEALERAPTRLTHQRERELGALLDPAVRRCLDEAGVALISYRDLGD